MINEALNYLHRASIIPLNGKIPAIPTWKEYQTRKATEDEVRAWWTKNPSYNIGIVTGKLSNITVVDVDQAEIPSWLPKTAMVKTGKGWHFYYQYEQGVANSARIRENIDIRGEGGYVVAPPSIHPQTGKAYAWESKGNIQPFPANLFGVTKARTDWDQMANGAPEGQRNESAAKYIGKLMQIFSPDTWENTVWETAKIWNEKNNPPLDPSELRHTYESIASRERQKDRPVEQTEEEIEESLITLDQVVATTSDEPRFSVGFSALDEVMMDDAHFAKQIQGGLAEGEFLALAGRPGHGKTLLAAQMTVAMQEQGIKSIWFSYEVGLSKLSNIFAKLGSDNTMISAVSVEKNMPMLGNIDWIEKHILSAVNKYGIKLVVIDNLDFLETRTKRESNFSMNQQAFLSVIVSELTKLTVQNNLMLVLLAHVRKPAVTGFSKVKRPFMYDIAGTSAVERLCSFGVIIDRKKDKDAEGNEVDTNLSTIYLDKNRASGVRKKVEVEYKNGRLVETHDQKLTETKEFLAKKYTL